MNKKITTISLLLITATLILSGCSLLQKKTAEESTESFEDNQSESMMKDGEIEQERVPRVTSAPEGAITYEITNGSSVSYQVNKTYFGKPSILVKGTTNNVLGYGWADFDNQKFNLEANIDLFSLSTDSSKRDSDIKNLFGAGDATVKLIKVKDTITKDKEFATTATLEITVNKVSQQTDFEINRIFTESGLEITGMGNTTISGFGIKAPGAENIFEVQDELELTFVIEAKTEISPKSMMQGEDNKIESMMGDEQ